MLQEALFALPNVEVIWNHTVEEICGEDMVESIRIREKNSGEEKNIMVDGIFVAVGIHPDTEIVRGLVACDESGYILAGEDTKTTISGIYVAGDVRKKPMRQIITAVADGANAATAAANFLNL